MRADRLLSILLLLQSRGRMTARSLAERLEVCERTILRDMEALGAAGVPVVADRGAGGGWRLIDGYQTKLTGLTAAEIQTLFLGRPPKLLADLGLKEAADAAWIKLQAALPIEVRERAEFVRSRILIDARRWRDQSEAIRGLPTLLEALWQSRRVRFVYEPYDPDRCDERERVVDPLGLVARGSTWYLIAQREGAIRTYRVSRIRDATVIAEPSARPPGFDLATHWEASSSAFREQLPRYYATFLAERSIMPWIRYRGWRLQDESAEGDRVRIRVRFDVEDEALMFALSFGPALEVLEPVALREKVIAAAIKTVEFYSATTATA
jgi:predicted DNA-binding transcriptional regulator YafY